MIPALIVGHMIGDYLLQTTWMATHKHTVSGWCACGTHCLIYTLTVAACVWWLTGSTYLYNPIQLFLVFNSHFWIDKYSFGAWWMDYVKGGRGDERFMPVVYCCVDNTLHLVLMLIITEGVR